MKEPSTQASRIGMRATAWRRRLGAGLLLGWAVFWFTATAQLCCIAFAAQNGTDELAPVAHANTTASNAGTPSLPSHPDTDCLDLSASGPGMSGAVTAVTDRPDFLMVSPSAPRLLERHVARSFSAQTLPGPLPPGTPLFLRTQRIRI